MNWIASSLQDEYGRYDVAYVSLFGVMGGVLGSIIVMTAMSVVSYLRCDTIVRETVLINCVYNPEPLGTAIGYVCTGFGVALGALAGYMAATRPTRPAAPPQQPSPITIQTSQQPAVQQVPAGPLKVDVVGLPDDPPK